ncbi:DUF3566 domain-containing protein [Nocardioides bizhenqiangii]|uniref:DUF3566 domain-containing protein n=1 Tax=Nocardioides bizhenqiangii TaxID=3095076 RepID=A0ABZ0ZS89_9ACTN|nr:MULTISPECIES: DUF3566 domain-containing protein [unclassified Nocardioides]MDZ5619338.1 DUF3566 domain-containing protein [Nocardioides sp. HM23]WQQ26641.1 DUF3566 domain-containing protein [Nocardioides sp. HM61]
MSDRTKEPTTVPVPTGAPVNKADGSAKPKVGNRPPQPMPDLPPPPADAPTPAAGPTVTTTAEVAPSQRPSSRGPRRARLRLTRVDPWSVMKTAFLLSIAFAVVTVVSVAMVWQVLGAAGVWDSINSTVQEAIGGEDVAGFQIQDYLGTSRVLGFTMLVAAIDVILITASATLTAFLYNMAAALLGGVEVTLAEDA